MENERLRRNQGGLGTRGSCLLRSQRRWPDETSKTCVSWEFQDLQGALVLDQTRDEQRKEEKMKTNLGVVEAITIVVDGGFVFEDGIDNSRQVEVGLGAFALEQAGLDHREQVLTDALVSLKLHDRETNKRSVQEEG